MAPTRFLIISDTHGQHESLGSLPKADVLIHCGDLTQVGGLSNYRRALEFISDAEAELKLIIAGNHDISLDESWWAANLVDDDDPDESSKAQALFKEAQTRRSGVHYLEEGSYTFSLKSGTIFKLYAIPYTPEFGGFAFGYEKEFDRFGLAAKNPIPNDIDIVVSHGPPALGFTDFRLDVNSKKEHCGCEHLGRAIERSRPLLHCFGHLHEGYGAGIVSWDTKTYRAQQEKTVNLQKRSDTLLVNGAMLNEAGRPNNEPWIFDIELESGELSMQPTAL